MTAARDVGGQGRCRQCLCSAASCQPLAKHSRDMRQVIRKTIRLLFVAAAVAAAGVVGDGVAVADERLGFECDSNLG